MVKSYTYTKVVFYRDGNCLFLNPTLNEIFNCYCILYYCFIYMFGHILKALGLFFCMLTFSLLCCSIMFSCISGIRLFYCDICYHNFFPTVLLDPSTSKTFGVLVEFSIQRLESFFIVPKTYGRHYKASFYLNDQVQILAL